MPPNKSNRAELKALLDDLLTAKVPIDNPEVERRLIAALRALLAEAPETKS